MDDTHRISEAQVEPTAHAKFQVLRLYRDTFGQNFPEVKGVSSTFLHNVALKALMRGTPITEEEVREFIRPDNTGAL